MAVISASIVNLLRRIKPGRLILMIVGLQFVLHLPFFSLPPVSQHTWRQVISLATARNYFEEDASLLYPRSDTRISREDPGFSYQEFPLIYWILGMSYHITGFTHTSGRVLAFILAALLLVAVNLLLKELQVKVLRRNLTLIAIGVSPLYFYYAVNLLPNIPAMTFFVAGLVFFVRSLRNDAFRWHTDLPGIILISLAVVTKATWLFYGLVLAGLAVRHLAVTRHKTKSACRIMVWAGGILLAAGLQYYHQFSVHNSNPFQRQDIITLGPAVVSGWQDFVAVFRSAAGLWFSEVTLGIPMLIFFLAGSVLAYARIKKDPGKYTFWIMWVLSGFLFTLCFFPLYRQHAYYQTHLLLVTGFVAALGMEQLLLNKKFRNGAVILMCLSLAYMSGRIMPRWSAGSQVPWELSSQISDFTGLIPEEDLVLIAGDPTPNVYLYYLHRKGLVDNGFNVNPRALADLHSRGFRWFIRKGGSSESFLQAPGVRLARKVGRFQIYRILDPV